MFRVSGAWAWGVGPPGFDCFEYLQLLGLSCDALWMDADAQKRTYQDQPAAQ